MLNGSHLLSWLMKSYEPPVLRGHVVGHMSYTLNSSKGAIGGIPWGTIIEVIEGSGGGLDYSF